MLTLPAYFASNVNRDLKHNVGQASNVNRDLKHNAGQVAYRNRNTTRDRFKRESTRDKWHTGIETQRGTGFKRESTWDRCQTGIETQRKGGLWGITGASYRNRETRNTTWDQPTPHADVDSNGNLKQRGGIKTGEK
ncbi:hypothetical protein TNCV_546251 [Trichonephila clavipes]|nr:hypothetical protein TNCV_546251 [Trichonephila clavipes]